MFYLIKVQSQNLQTIKRVSEWEIYAQPCVQPRAVRAYMTMEDAYQVKITLQLRTPHGDSNSLT